ncbi:DUF2817 domain-containing protein [Agarivorans sp. MS3-6]|uniref:DUF2817 domain-containing protein n=1 Tax=Agarivorans sp. TSD2052 TaxID=2937286 RepID=UPI00200C936F|nr:DUF2817 domain-containing protein [Agarivorans sp. TSD2052]UPW20626.1 DUF2817 domain-containing protein [Agarivorans sp. TSD2052]
MPTQHYLPELEQLAALTNQYANYLSVERLCEVSHLNMRFPVEAISLGIKDKSKPCICFIGGVHGVERIGSQVVLSFMSNLLSRLSWDQQLNQLLTKICVYFIPIVNPIGMALQRRSNGNGVDLMRNSPTIAPFGASLLVGGQRFSKHFPWYQGDKNQPMELESQALCEFVKRSLLGSPYSLVLDCHSGFGQHDRIWFPYAKSAKAPIDDIASVYRLREVFFESFPHQNYLFEPQTKHYTCHGDLWDYCYDQSLQQPGIFIPLTLEMGSWRWLKKNPLQLFSGVGLFHPMKKHRVQRVLRQHLVLMEFLMNSCYSWRHVNQANRLLAAQQQAKQFWY